MRIPAFSIAILLLVLWIASPSIMGALEGLILSLIELAMEMVEQARNHTT